MKEKVVKEVEISVHTIHPALNAFTSANPKLSLKKKERKKKRGT
jgi:hypothetical protein